MSDIVSYIMNADAESWINRFIILGAFVWTTWAFVADVRRDWSKN